MIKSYISIAALALILVAGCASPKVEETSVSEHGDTLFEKANALAKDDLIQFNAIEMVYRNIPEMRSILSPATQTPVSGWVKVYRRISSYTIEDVKRTDSLIRPIVYDISYHFDVFGTQYRYTTEKNALAATLNDNKYTKQYTSTLKRQYYCDENGIPVDLARSVLPRPMYFEADYLNERIDDGSVAGLR